MKQEMAVLSKSPESRRKRRSTNLTLAEANKNLRVSTGSLNTPFKKSARLTHTDSSLGFPESITNSKPLSATTYSPLPNPKKPRHFFNLPDIPIPKVGMTGSSQTSGSFSLTPRRANSPRGDSKGVSSSPRDMSNGKNQKKRHTESPTPEMATDKRKRGSSPREEKKSDSNASPRPPAKKPHSPSLPRSNSTGNAKASMAKKSTLEDEKHKSRFKYAPSQAISRSPSPVALGTNTTPHERVKYDFFRKNEPVVADLLTPLYQPPKCAVDLAREHPVFVINRRKLTRKFPVQLKSQQQSAFRVSFKLTLAKGLSTKYGTYFIVKLNSTNGTETTWSTPVSFGKANPKWNKTCTVHSLPTMVDVSLVVEVWKLEKKKNKLLSSASVSSSVVSKNSSAFTIASTSQIWIQMYKDIQVFLEYTISPINILSNREYLPLAISLLQDDLSMFRRLLGAIRGNPENLTIALSFLSSLGVINFVIDQAIEIEISSCNAVGTLFRQDTIHTCVLDTYIKKIGSKYLNATLKPFVHEILEKRPECLLDTTDVSKDGIEKNLQKMVTLAERLVNTITSSTTSCPLEMKLLLSKVHSAAIDKWPYELDTWVTAVTAFLFLRFFVPALLDPCKYNLCNEWELRFQEKETLMNLGIIIQKMANFSKFQPNSSNSFHLLNDVIKSESFRIYEWTTALCDKEKLDSANPSEISENFGLNSALLAMLCKENLLQIADTDERLEEFSSILKKLEEETFPALFTTSDSISPR